MYGIRWRILAPSPASGHRFVAGDKAKWNMFFAEQMMSMPGVGGQEVSEWRFGQRFQLPIYAAIIEVFHTFQ